MTGNLDVVGRREGHDLRASTATDPEDGLRRLYSTDARRKTRTRLTVVAVVVGALTAGLVGRGVLTHEDVAPAHPTPGGVNPPSTLFDLADPVRLVIPPEDSVADGFPTATRLDVTSGGGYWGVIVAEKVRPTTTSGQAAHGVGSSPSAHRIADWVASRSYLDTTTPQRTTLAGRAAWQVRARIAKGAEPAQGRCGPQLVACYPVMLSGSGTTNARGDRSTIGMWGDVVADCTLVDLPSGTAVVWSWNFNANLNLGLSTNRGVIDTITWPHD